MKSRPALTHPNRAAKAPAGFVLCPTGLWGMPIAAKALEKKILNAGVREDSAWARTVAYGKLMGLPWAKRGMSRWATLFLVNGITLRQFSNEHSQTVLDSLPQGDGDPIQLWRDLRERLDLRLAFRNAVTALRRAFESYFEDGADQTSGAAIGTIGAVAVRAGWLLAERQDDLALGEIGRAHV